MTRTRARAVALLLAAVALLPSCYLTRVAWGGAEILCKRKPVEQVLESEDLTTEERHKLELTQRVRRFAFDELGLPDNGSYRGFVGLDRRYVVWNVVAAPELSVEPLTWCFPVAGCVSYRGYFRKSRAETFAARMEREGHDVTVYGVDAFSTLGRFRDPVLSTFLRRQDADLAALLIHELAHQRVYVKGDTAFNEAFATVVETEGTRRWLEAEGHGEELEPYLLGLEIDRRFVSLLLGARRGLDEVYRSDLSREAKLRRKTEVLRELRHEYEDAKQAWGGDAAYDPWFERPVNNARLASVADYHDLTGPLEALLGRCGGLTARFYEAVEELGRLDRDERRRRLRQLVTKASE